MLNDTVKAKRGTVVVGIGNPLLKDDRAGIEVAERVEALGLPVTVEVLHTVGFEAMDKVMGFDRAFVVDACQLGHPPGTVLDLRLDDIFSDGLLSGSHAATLGGTLKAGQELFPGEMPMDLRIILIEIEDASEFCPACTPAVQAAVERVVEMIRQECNLG
ncbi:MAG: hydrogenase maturation protease [Deltaproteobacteria bacterium]|nr:hydrogenase maturation protease [Deltaproteobacteria bacterium]